MLVPANLLANTARILKTNTTRAITYQQHKDTILQNTDKKLKSSLFTSYDLRHRNWESPIFVSHGAGTHGVKVE